MKKSFLSSFLVVIILAFITLLGINQAESSIVEDAYSSNPEEFYTQLQELFSKTKNQEATTAIEQFIAYAGSGELNSEQLEGVIAVCNAMAEKRMRTTPHYTRYLKSINAMAGNGMLTKFADWNSITLDLVVNAKRGQFGDITNFLNFSDDFFNNEVLFKTSGKRWIIQTVDYNLPYEEGVPAVTFEEATLICATAKDTMFIFDTKGKYLPFENRWEGESGRVTWGRAGLDPNTVYAEIPAYTVDTKRDQYEVEQVTFYHKEFFNRPLKGVLTDKISSRIAGQYLYPEFKSYELDILMENFAPQTKLNGGFSMQGNKVVGYGTEEQKATLDFYSKDNIKAMRASSKSFALTKGVEVHAQKTSIALYFANDSIYHPQLNMRYDFGAGEPELRLVRDGKASSKIAFMSSYHDMEANVDQLSWKLNTPVVDFKMVSQLKDLPVIFESFNLYDEKRLEEYTMFTSIDPVFQMYNYCSGEVPCSVHAQDFARYLSGNYTKETILNSIFEMVEDGFIYFDPETDMITARQKTINYIKSKKGEVDYDRIMLVSRSDAENAQFDIESKILLITGLERITLSDSQKVTIFPRAGITRIKENRDMEVDGTLVAGMVDFVGKDFFFNYQPFTFKMDSVDQLKIYIAKDDDLIANRLEPIKTLVRDVSGTLYIDEENNKSGLENYPSFPRFESEGNSYLYYDNRNIYGGAYKRDSFYFQLDPFTFPDLDSITSDLLNFPGTMISAEIFPPFDEVTRLQPDLSLGFIKETDARGLPLYERGNFTGTINMSGEGMKGSGQVDYMASSMTSEEYVFLPDSMMAVADTFYQVRSTVKGVEFPSAHNGKVSLRWRVKDKGLYVYMKERPFTMFDEKTNFKGKLIINDQGSFGAGTMNWEDASIRAEDFAFKSATFKSDSADVVIKNKDAARVAFNSYNVKARVDMDQMLGEFLANGDNIPIILPYNQFKTTASEFYWLMEDKIVNIRMPEDENESYFTSTRPDQDGLRFQASGGVVNLEENTIQVDGIPYITIGDARIRPSDTKVTIDPNASIRTLENALLVADTISEYHKLYKADIKIKGANEFEGSGEVRYRGKDMRRQRLEYSDVSTQYDEENERYYTYGTTDVPEDADFKLSNNIRYKGNAILDSREPFMTFEGFAKIELETDGIEAQWFAFKDVIDPENIQIDVTEPIGERKDTLLFGVLQDMESLRLYPAFLTKKHTSLDPIHFRSVGELEYDSEQELFTVTSSEEFDDDAAKGNVFQFDDKNGKFTATGRFSIGEDWGKADLDIGGTMSHEVSQGMFNANDMMMGFDFPFEDGLLQSIGETIRYYNAETSEIDYTKESLFDAGLALVSKKAVSEYKQAMGNGYLGERLKGLEQTILFSDIDFVYDYETFTYLSQGPIGISFIGDKYINRTINGAIEIGERQTGDFINIYLETERDPEGNSVWYYFNYTKNKLEVLSSDPNFNDAIMAMKEKKRIIEDKKTGAIYEFKLAPMQKRNIFVYTILGDGNTPPPPPPPVPSPQQDSDMDNGNNGGGSNLEPAPTPNEDMPLNDDGGIEQDTNSSDPFDGLGVPLDDEGINSDDEDGGKKKKKKKKGDGE